VLGRVILIYHSLSNYFDKANGDSKLKAALPLLQNATGTWQVFKVPFFDRGQLIAFEEVVFRCGSIFLLIFINIWTKKLEVSPTSKWQNCCTCASTLRGCIHNSIRKIMLAGNFGKQ
jgi:hypothetical protein